jgi:hypothetical protein
MDVKNLVTQSEPPNVFSQATATAQREVSAQDISLRLDALDEAQDIITLFLGPQTPQSARLAEIAASVREGIQLGSDNLSLAAELDSAATIIAETSTANCESNWNSSRFVGEILPQVTELVGLDRIVNHVFAKGKIKDPDFDMLDGGDLKELRSGWITRVQKHLPPNWHGSLSDSIATSNQLEAMLVANLDQVRLAQRPPFWQRLLRIGAIGLAFAAAMVLGVALTEPDLGLPSLSWLVSHVVLELGLGAVALGIWFAVAQDRVLGQRAAAIHSEARAAVRAALARGVEVPIVNLLAAKNRLIALSDVIAGS